MSVRPGPYLRYSSAGKTEKEAIARAEERAAEAAVAILEEKAVAPRERIVVRDVDPNIDLGISGYSWEVTPAAAGWTNIVGGHQLSEKKAMVIYGFKIVTQGDVTMVEVATGANGNVVKTRINIDKYDEQSKTIILREFIGFEPKDYVWIKAYSTGTSTFKIVPLAVVAEPTGELISP